MTDPRCPTLQDLVDYQRGELTAAREEALEDHYFACERCTARLEGLARLGDGVRELVAAGRIGASVTGDLVERAAREGLTVRRYVLRQGEPVACTAAPEDDFVAVTLAGPFGEGEDWTLEVGTQPAGGEPIVQHRPVLIDRARDAVVLLFPGDAVRAYPRSAWTMHLRTGGERRAGPYHMEHTPWEELPAGARS